MSSITHELRSPSTIVQLFAVILNAVTVVGAYKSNPIYVTICGMLGVLATLAGSVLTKMQTSSRRRLRDSDLESTLVDLSTSAQSSGTDAPTAPIQPIRERRVPDDTKEDAKSSTELTLGLLGDETTQPILPPDFRGWQAKKRSAEKMRTRRTRNWPTR